LSARNTHAPPGAVHRVDLDDALGQVRAYPRNQGSCNLIHELPLSKFQIDSPQVNLGASTPSTDWGSPFVFAQAERQRHFNAQPSEA
jgi:hypothetical protein